MKKSCKSRGGSWSGLGAAAIVATGLFAARAAYADPAEFLPPPEPVPPRISAEQSFPSVELAVLDGSANSGDNEYLIQLQLAQADEDVNDPLEGFNRAVFAFNQVVYDGILGPASDAYNLLPDVLRTMISSFLSNLKEPLVFVNDILQGEFLRAMDTFARFSMNSTFGFAGLADVATPAGIPGHNEDFGQTLAVWGVGEGPYLVLPILGPSTPRDAIGKYGVDTFIDPVNIYLENHDEDDWISIRAGVAGFTEFAAIRDELLALQENSLDYYAAVRSLYYQRRAAEISNGDGSELPAIPDFEFSDFPEFDEPQPATGNLDDSDGESGDELSDATVPVAQPYKGDPFVAEFQPVYGHSDDLARHRDAWQAEVVIHSTAR